MAFVDLSMAGLQGQQAFADRMQTLASAKNTEATAKVNEANAAATMFELSESERLAEIEQRAAASLSALTAGERVPGSGFQLDDSSAASPHEFLGRFYIEAGAVEQGTKLLNEAADIRKQESEIERAGYLNQTSRLDNIKKGADIVSQTLGIAQNEDEYRLGLQRLRKAVDDGVFVMEPELLERLEAMPWDPNLPAYFNQAAIDAKGRADLELKEQSEARRAAEAAARLAQGNTRIQIAAARLAETQRHNSTMEKFAGTASGVTVKPAERDAMAARLIAGPLASFVDPVTAEPVKRDSSIVQDLAIRLEEDAQLIFKRTDGITMDQARERAVQTAIANGEIVPEKPDTRPFFLPSNAEPAQVKRSSARDTAIRSAPTVTVDGQQRIDVSKLEVGESYWVGNRRLTWDGEGFEE